MADAKICPICGGELARTGNYRKGHINYRYSRCCKCNRRWKILIKMEFIEEIPALFSRRGKRHR